MDPERWQRVTELFHAALERPVDERETFLAAACADDPALRREVDSLLAAHADASDFIDTPAIEAAAELLTDAPAPAPEALVGTRLGPYRIESSLGHGGMGAVYLARDERLDRRVAIKALAEHLVGDQRSRERLRREAKAAAALSHPAIAAVFSLEELDERLYIVYEYAEGPTLRECLARGPLDWPGLLVTALSIARALQAAHDAGIVHRDLKPENIVRRADGNVKVLDFGLASVQAPPASGTGAVPSPERLTMPGLLLGTPAYMSPEQIRGRDVDFTSDLFSFGVLLYEMAAGRHPFAERGDPAATMARILEVEPGSLDGEPAALEPILQRLLAKHRGERYAATSDVVLDLESLAHGSGPVPAAGRAAPASNAPGEAVSAPSGATEHSMARPARHDASWWWRFHQLAVVAVYGAGLAGLWWGKELGAATDGRAGAAMFYVGVAAAIAAGSLRLHLLFATRYYPGELRRQLRQAAPWVRGAELLYAVVLLIGAALLGSSFPLLGALMVAVAAGLPLFALVIEPTTTRAAFPAAEPEDPEVAKGEVDEP